jgi:predicted transcriptional regulator
MLIANYNRYIVNKVEVNYETISYAMKLLANYNTLEKTKDGKAAIDSYIKLYKNALESTN